MKRSILTIIAALALSPVLSFNSASAQVVRKTDWNLFSKNLVMAVKSSNEGLKLSAMQQIIHYADNLNVTQARYEIMNVFLTHKNPRVRQLALAALSKINNTLDMGFLQRQMFFEEHPVIKKQIAAALIKAGRSTGSRNLGYLSEK
jgi:hypothetical protein